MNQRGDVSGAGEARTKPIGRVVVPAAFFRNGRRPPFVLFDSHGGLLDPAAAEQVRLSPGDLDALRVFLLDHGAEWMSDPLVPREARTWALRELLPGVAEALLVNDQAAQRALEPMQRVTAMLAQHALSGPRERSEMCLLLDRGDLRVTRAVDNALLVTALAAERGEDDPRVLTALAQAGLLADLSVVRMPRMTGVDPQSQDREAYQRHPALSQELVRRMGIGSPVVHYAIAAHHERWDGRGYPKQLAGDRIPIEGRLLAVADGVSQLARARGDIGVASRETLAAALGDRGRFDVELLRLLVRLLAEVALARDPGPGPAPVARSA